MKNKILLILFSLVVFTLPFQQTYMETQAAIISKAGSLTAKKIMKEVIEDAAANQAASMAVLEATEIIENYQAKEGYKVVCPAGGKTCDKPVQVKSTITEADKANIKNHAGTELDKMISPNGKGLSRWGKFIDWFIPVWLTMFAVTAITYAVDPEVKSLIDETAYNALVAAGIIVPISTTEVVPIGDSLPSGTVTADLTGVQSDFSFRTHSNLYVRNQFLVDHSSTGVTIVSKFNVQDPASSTTATFAHWNIDYYELKYRIPGQTQMQTLATYRPADGFYTTLASTQAVAVSVNSGPYTNMTRTSQNYGFWGVPAAVKEQVNINTKQLEAVRTRLPYEVGGNWYTDVLFNTVDGNTIHFQMMQNSPPINSQKIDRIEANLHVTAIGTRSMETTAYPNTPTHVQIMHPFEELPGMDATGQSSYGDGKGNIALIPPTAITYIDETTGETVYRVPAPAGGGHIFIDQEGNPVPEENVVPKEDQPKAAPSPEGIPQITPEPTPSNPAPEPIPLQPDPAAPPGPTAPPGSEPPLEPFPEGESCTAKLKFPVFSPLKETFSTSFPFSIPWDIERAINAAFGGISSEKPAFTFTIPFGESSHTIRITTPAFFDNWKPFTDSFLVLTFDVLIMFGVYRFVKGGGS